MLFTQMIRRTQLLPVDRQWILLDQYMLQRKEQELLLQSTAACYKEGIAN